MRKRASTAAISSGERSYGHSRFAAFRQTLDKGGCSTRRENTARQNHKFAKVFRGTGERTHLIRLYAFRNARHLSFAAGGEQNSKLPAFPGDGSSVPSPFLPRHPHKIARNFHNYSLPLFVYSFSPSLSPSSSVSLSLSFSRIIEVLHRIEPLK